MFFTAIWVLWHAIASIFLPPPNPPEDLSSSGVKEEEFSKIYLLLRILILKQLLYLASGSYKSLFVMVLK